MCSMQIVTSLSRRAAGMAVVVFASAFLLTAAVPAGAQGPANYIVLFRADAAPAARADAVGRAGAALRVNFRGVAATAVAVSNAAVLAALERDPSVLAVIPNRTVRAVQRAEAGNGKGKPSGGGGGGPVAEVLPAGVVRVGAPTGLSNGAGIGVAIVDTGVDLAHADLAVSASTFSALGGSCQDDNDHGTHVAGIVAALDNDIDVVGVAPQATIYCVKVLDQSGSGSDVDVMNGLDWVLANHADVTPAIRVINMSLGRPGSVGDNPAMHQLVQDLVADGVAVVVAAGNDATSEVSEQIPAAYPEAMAIASTTAATGSNQCRFLSSPIGADTASFFTTDGTGVLVSAPGEEQEDVNKGCFIKSSGILSTKRGGGTMRMSGTSMASPHVAGIAARYFQQNPSYSVADVRAFIAADADRQGTAPLASPTASYSFDGVLEGVAQAP